MWNNDQGYDSTLTAFDASLDRLGLECVDLYLIHWQSLQRDKYVDTWKAFEQLYADKRVRAIGVSNFHEPALRRLFEETTIRPAVNQIELHPALPQDELRAFNAENDIVTQAWSPLASGELLDNPTLKTLGEKRQVAGTDAIRRHLQLGNVVIPKSKTRAGSKRTSPSSTSSSTTTTWPPSPTWRPAPAPAATRTSSAEHGAPAVSVGTDNFRLFCWTCGWFRTALRGAPGRFPLRPPPHGVGAARTVDGRPLLVDGVWLGSVTHLDRQATLPRPRSDPGTGPATGPWRWKVCDAAPTRTPTRTPPV